MCKVYVKAPPFATWTDGSAKVVIIMNIMVIIVSKMYHVFCF